MPVNPSTGRANRHALKAADVLEFRIKQVEEQHAESLKQAEQKQRAEMKKGKRSAPDSPGAEEEEGSVPSPLAPIISFGRLSLDCDRPPLPDPDHALPARKSRKRSKPSPSKFASKPHSAAPTQDLAGPTSEKASTSQLLMPVPQQGSRSPESASPASDSSVLSNASRIALLEAKQAETEKLVRELDARLKKLGG
jgi:hypothetical protein